MLSAIGKKLNTLGPVEVSLQKAELAIEQGDVRIAEAQATAVVKAVRASGEQVSRAEAVIAKAEAAKTAAAPDVYQTLEKAAADLNAGRYSDAKAGFVAVLRSGVALNATQTAMLEGGQDRILEIEKARGVAFDSSTAAASMLPQAGVVKKVDPPPADAHEAEGGAPSEPPPYPTPTYVEGSGDAATQQKDPSAQKKDDASAQQKDEASGQQKAETSESGQPASGEAPASGAAAMSYTPAAQPPATDPLAEGRRYTAQSLRAEADQDFNEARYNPASDKYQRLLAEYGDLLTAEEQTAISQRIAEARLRIGQNIGASGDELAGVINQNLIVKQQALAEYNNQQEQARKALESGDTVRARDLAVGSRLTINNARNVLSEAEYETYQKQVDDLLTEIDTQGRSLAERAALEKAKANEKMQADEAQAGAARKERKIREAYARVRELQQQMDYQAALQVVNEQILFLDPINPAGLILKEILTDSIVYRRVREIGGKIRLNHALASVENYEAAIPSRGIVDYPADWPAISARRGEQLAFNDSEENRRVGSILATKRQPIDFNEVPLSDAVGFVREISQINIDVDWGSLAAINVTPESPVSLKLTNVTLKTVLDRMLEKVSPDERSRAAWAINDGVLTIASDETLRKNTTLVIYDIKDLLIEIPDFTNAPQFDLQSVLQSSTGTGGGGGGGGQSPFRDTQRQNQNGQQGGFGVPMRTREERTNDLLQIIQQNVDPDGWADAGGTTGRIQQLNGGLIITNTPRNHQAISGLLSKLREIRAMQINVETRFLIVSQDFFEQINFDIDVYWNANNNQVRAARGVDPTVQASDFFNFAGGRQGNRGLQRNVTGANPTTGTTSPDINITQGVVNPRNTSVIGAGQNSGNIAGEMLAGLVDADSAAGIALATAPALGIAGQFLDDVQVDFLIQATQADRRSVRLNAPRLTMTNGQTSNIYVATQTAFVSDLTPIVSESAVGFDPELATISEGVVLLVEGTITADRRYVTMNISTSVAKIDGFANVPVSAVAGGGLANSATTNSFIQAPTVTVTSVSTTATVPDQGTMLLGGQRLVNEYEVESGVPVLSKIPILNRFFSNRIKARDEQTLLILMKPTIMIQNEQEEQNFPGLLDSLRGPFGG